MSLEIRQAEIEDKLILRNLLEIYQHDHSEFDGDDVDQFGRYGYHFLDHYWTERGRYAFIVYVSGAIAGFALVRTLAEGEKGKVYSMAEFFIMRKYRGQGHGRTVAHALFDRFPGQWQVRQVPRNLPAQTFWRKVISTYTNGDFEEIQNHYQSGPTQIFMTGIEGPSGNLSQS